ncbi:MULTISPECIES: acyl-CoA dehydrogenase family protein [Arthrobacter]|uniref:Acyl-CoA dehydrogenase family protein n=1 Tax=Arthrobacter caoxuetaonis TaxID=2886935 RepID=A0A9X1MBJ3_9MICC|nr:MULTISPECIES: acyl-CoA dehydrogenase family protein [Arthrobacter]MCC3280796.1 acyl-CoA dehydrogenase family protein [Arthrobacter caoxuetaonis]MCC3296964.1 acyl-CoA dehydrogenase family protein [Arthrobacter caoxuetaonis]MCC9193040.1 acyl-CoA dehydrogenase family protein [Arthrobacter sp. zg-Y916]USQ56225.1 acyl-CoA dehydrogenase family protein [Arthrobacter caoxuetaonis]
MSTTTTGAAATELLTRAEEMVPVLRERAGEAESLRRLPEETIADYRAAGFFTAMVPADRGGSALSLQEFADLIRVLSRGDASAGWIAAFLISHSTLLYRYGAAAQSEFFAEKPYGLTVAASAPPGKAEPADGGYRLSGRWRFGSGAMHAEWATLSAMSPEGPLSVTVPMTELEIIDTWHVPGMKATGSNDLAADNVFVPAHRTAPFATFASGANDGAALTSYPLIGYPMNRTLNLIHSAVAIGTADAALELFAQGLGKRVRMQTQQRVIDEPITRQTYGKAWDLVQVAALQMQDSLAHTDRVYGAHAAAPASLADRARINLGLTGSGQKAFQAVDLVARASGASIYRTGDHLDRIVRDTQVMRNHAAIDFETMASVAGGALLGAGIGDYADPMF